MKKVLALLLIFAMAFSLVACSGGDGGSSSTPSSTPSSSGGDASSSTPSNDKSYTLKFAHIRPEGSPSDIAFNAFKDEVEEKSGGSIKIDIYPANQLGDYTVVQERVSLGDVEMLCGSVGTSVNKNFGTMNLPYLASNWTQAKEIFYSTEWLGQQYKAWFADMDIEMLCAYPLYYGAVITKDAVKDPTTVNVSHNIKIRVPPQKVYEVTATMLGYIATPIAFADTFTSMQTGIVDGSIGAGAEGYYGNFKDLAKHLYAYNDHFEMWYMIINKPLFDGMSDAQKTVLQEAAMNCENNRWEIAEAETGEYEGLLEEAGCEIHHFTDDQLAVFATAGKEQVWPAVREDYDVDVFDELIGQFGD